MIIDAPEFIHTVMRTIGLYIPRYDLVMYQLEVVDNSYLLISHEDCLPYPTSLTPAHEWHISPVMTITPGPRRGQYYFRWTILSDRVRAGESEWAVLCTLVNRLVESHDIQFARYEKKGA